MFEIAVPLKCLIIISKTFEMSLINCEIILILVWQEQCVISIKSVNRKRKPISKQLFVFSFQHKKSTHRYYLPSKSEIKNCNIVIDRTFLIYY